MMILHYFCYWWCCIPTNSWSDLNNRKYTTKILYLQFFSTVLNGWRLHMIRNGMFQGMCCWSRRVFKKYKSITNVSSFKIKVYKNSNYINKLIYIFALKFMYCSLLFMFKYFILSVLLAYRVVNNSSFSQFQS